MPMLLMLFAVLRKKEIKEQMRQELKYGELVTVFVPEREVIWMDDHEIWVNNSMFDIAEKKLENGVYTFKGMYDKAETELVKKERAATGKSTEQNKLLSHLFKSIPKFCTQQFCMVAPIAADNHYAIIPSSSPVNPFREILTPPPQLRL